LSILDPTQGSSYDHGMFVHNIVLYVATGFSASYMACCAYELELSQIIETATSRKFGANDARKEEVSNVK